MSWDRASSSRAPYYAFGWWWWQLLKEPGGSDEGTTMAVSQKSLAAARARREAPRKRGRRGSCTRIDAPGRSFALAGHKTDVVGTVFGHAR